MRINSPKSFLLALSVIMVAGCAHQPRTIESAWEIRWAPASEYMVSVVDLPIQDYPKLQKFSGLKHLQISGEKRPVTDKEIRAVGHLQFPQLMQVSLAQCRNVTDDGVQSLTNLPSIQGLHLRAVGITDRGMQVLAARFPNLKSINVEQCRSVTEEGFLDLTISSTINSVVMSQDPFSQQQIERIITMVPNVTWWTISDPRHQLNHESLRQLGDAKNLTIQVVDENNTVEGITRAQPGGPANGTQPIRSETNRTSSAAGSRR